MQPPQLPLWILTHLGTPSAQQVYSLSCCISTCPLCSLFLLHVRHPFTKQMLARYSLPSDDLANTASSFFH